MIDFDKKHPRTLVDAVRQIINNLEPDEIECIEAESSMAPFHHTVGRSIRNGWKLWDPATELVAHFEEFYMISHPDDISGIILDSVYSQITGQEYNPFDAAKKYQKYWESNYENHL